MSESVTFRQLAPMPSIKDHATSVENVFSKIVPVVFWFAMSTFLAPIAISFMQRLP